MRKAISGILLVVLSGSVARALPPALTEGLELVWSDEFAGATLDGTKWEHAPEWKRRENQWWSDQDAYLDGTNNLVLRMRRENGSIYAGAIRTRRDWPFDDRILFDRTFGYFEIRTTFPVIPDGWGAFWMMPSAGNPYTVTNGIQGSEIDIFETIHSTQGWINHAIYWGSYGTSKDVTGMPDLYEGYHTVGLLWTDKEYRFYVDDVETWRTTANDAVMQVPAYLKITMEANPGAYDYLADPKTMLVDYVRVYAHVPPTVTVTGIEAGNGSCVLQWQGSLTNLLYMVESCTNLPAAGWSPPTPTSQWWISESVWTNTQSVGDREFFRIRAKEQ
jgi:beta-glucanase (GH16 family)